jgi:diguanylate cyclase (GGDEF)-like protein/PAS domain S-box-containing protein
MHDTPRARILIVDDVDVNLDVVAGMLKGEHECITASSGEQALRLLAQGLEPDLVLLDVMMPGMSGYDVCGALKRHPVWRDIPVIFVTARVDPRSESEALSGGAVDFIHKPVKMDVLRTRVRLHLRLQQQHREVRASEARMRLASEAAHFGILEYDLRRGTAYWAGEAYRLFGLDADRSPPLLAELPSLMHPDDVANGQQLLRRALDPDGDGALQTTFRIVRPDGTERWVRCTGRTAFAGEGSARRAVRVNGLLLDVTEEEQSRRRIDFLAYHDPLTGLPNRVLGLQRLEQALAVARRHQIGLSVVYLDLDAFKFVNDSHGHMFGDAALRGIAARIGSCLRAEDTLCRLSGDEFMVVLTHVQGAASVAQFCERIVALSAEPLEVDGVQVSMTMCAGAVVHPHDGDTAQELMVNADTALHEAKKSGPGTWRFYEAQMNANLVHYLQTRDALALAIERGEFELHYQPRVSLVDGRPLGAEALLRWRRPGHGMVPPMAFIGVAEETGQIVQIGRWVLREACRQAAAWKAAGWHDFVVAVNLSAVQFRQGSVEQDVVLALHESGLPPGLLEIELTESILFRCDQTLSSMLERWKALGIRLAIDDFGTGYSNLAYLKRLDVHALKIDRSFITHLMQDEQDQLIVKAMLQLARGLNLATVAEGIEDAALAALLREMGCDEAQGYFYSKPLPAAELERWVAASRAEASSPVGVAT